MNTPGRQGLTETQIRDAISRLQAEGLAPSPGKVRSILGSGSYSTIGAVLAKWREEQEAAATSEIAEPPAVVVGLFRQLWREAQKAANQTHDAERAGFQAERTAWQQTKAEMNQEIERLESALHDCQQELDECTRLQEQQSQDLASMGKVLAAAQARVEALENETTHLREERLRSEQLLAQLTERAAKAEALVLAK